MSFNSTLSIVGRPFRGPIEVDVELNFEPPNVLLEPRDLFVG